METVLHQETGRHRQERALVMELLHRYGGLKQRMIAERFGGLDEGLVSREKIETEPKILKWFFRISDLTADDLVSKAFPFLGILFSASAALGWIALTTRWY
jgi:hypothetical protein